MTLHVERAGHGPVPLVLIHGWAMHGGMFAPLVEALASRCTMYVVDLPGHGHSRDCGLSLEPRACAEAIASEVPPAVWLGWSLGGLMALTAALDKPQHVLGLAMLCATPKFVRSDDWPQGNDASLVQQLAAESPFPIVAQLRDSQAYVLLASLGKGIFDYQSEQVRGHQEDWKPLLRWIKRQAA